MPRRRLRVAVVGLLSLVTAVLTGCRSPGGSGGDLPTVTTVAGERTLRLATAVPVTSVDPDRPEGPAAVQLITALYQGLVAYAADSTASIVGDLADRWERSEDGLTYRFTLRGGVSFSGGGPVDAAAVRASFARRTDPAVASPLAGGLSAVAGYDTPDPATFVIHLARPDLALLDHLASAEGPRVVDPAVVAAHGADQARGWLRTASAGTGPYVVGATSKGVWVLARNPAFPGTAPAYAHVALRVVADPADQVAALERGELDVVDDPSATVVADLGARAGFDVVTFPALQKAWVHLNPGRAPLDERPLRAALRAAIDRPALVAQVWGPAPDPSAPMARVSDQLYPPGLVPPVDAPEPWAFAPMEADAALGDAPLVLVYAAEHPGDVTAAQALADQLEVAGLHVRVVAVDADDRASWREDLTRAPHLFYEVAHPASAHPTSWAGPWWGPDAAPDVLGGGAAAAASVVARAVAAPVPTAAATAFAAAGDDVYRSVGYLSLADVSDTFVARVGALDGLGHWLTVPATLALSRAG